jgi:D-3-phosphoglycerate dehydrogenase
MPLVLVSGRIHEDGLKLLRSRPGLLVEELPDERPETFLARMPAADALLLRTAPLPREALVNCPRLKIVSRHGVGYDNVPVDALTALGVPVAIVGGVHAHSVAEQALFLMLALAKSGLRHDGAVRGGDWEFRSRLEAVELSGRALLIVGFGRIGRAVAHLARAFGMRVRAYDPAVPPSAMLEAGVEPVADWRAALPETDIVTLHLPRLPETENMIGAAELAAMKAGAFLVNTARGGLVDEAALAEAIATGHFGGAGLDTFEREPPVDHPLFASDRVILSPHIAGVTQESVARLSVASAENVLAGLDGRLDPALVVNPSVLRGPVPRGAA